MSWQALGAVAPTALSGARNQAHHAAQIIAAVGETLLEHAPDTSHTTLHWSDEFGGFQDHPLPQASNLRVGLRLSPFEIVVTPPENPTSVEGKSLGGLSLAGATRQEAGRGVLGALAARAERDLGVLTYPTYALPGHPLADGAAFEADVAALSELQRWFANAHAALESVLPRLPDPGAILCWPHHFDIAVLATVERDVAGEATRTIGVGLSPGDEAIEEPYWYVSHWPATERTSPPTLPSGEWTTQGFTGGLLRGSEVTAREADQRERVEAFLTAAIAAG